MSERFTFTKKSELLPNNSVNQIFVNTKFFKILKFSCQLHCQ